jgi:hypothetical protein
MRPTNFSSLPRGQEGTTASPKSTNLSALHHPHAVKQPGRTLQEFVVRWGCPPSGPAHSTRPGATGEIIRQKWVADSPTKSELDTHRIHTRSSLALVRKCAILRPLLLAIINPAQDHPQRSVCAVLRDVCTRIIPANTFRHVAAGVLS